MEGIDILEMQVSNEIMKWLIYQLRIGQITNCFCSVLCGAQL